MYIYTYMYLYIYIYIAKPSCWARVGEDPPRTQAPGCSLACT